MSDRDCSRSSENEGNCERQCTPPESDSESPVSKGHLEAFFPYLTYDSLLACSRVSRLWRDLAKDNSFWRQLCLKDWPAIECSSVFNTMPLASGAKDLYRRLTLGRRRDPPLQPKDVELLLDISLNDRPVFSECLPYSTNKMLQCFPEGISLGDCIAVLRPSLSHNALLSSMLGPFQNQLLTDVREKVEAYVGNLSVSLIALRKMDCKFFHLLDGRVSVAAWEGREDGAPGKNVEKGLGRNVVPLVVRQTHVMGATERLEVSFFLYANFLTTGSKPASTKLELMDYAFSISSTYREEDDTQSSKQGLSHLVRVPWT